MDQNLKAYNDMANRRKDPKMDKAIAKESLRSYNKNTPMKRDRVVAGFKARRQAKMKDLLKNAVGALGRVASPVAAGASAIKNFRKKKPDFQKGDYSGIKIKRAGGGSIRGYGAARTSGMGLQDESIQPGKVIKADMGEFIGKLTKPMRRLFGKGTKTAASGMNQPKSVGLGKMLPDLLQKAVDDGTIKTAKQGKMMKYKRGSGLDLPVINSVKPTVNKTKRAQNLSRMKIQFNKQRSRAGINSGTLDKILSKTKNPYSDLKATTAKGPKQYSSMAEMRKAKGFNPGESASEFNKRRKILAGVTKAASATKIGKIALGIGAVGLGAKKYLESKMNKKEVKKKMSGGMMKKYSEGMTLADMKPYGGSYVKKKEAYKADQTKNVRRLTTSDDAYSPEKMYVTVRDTRRNSNTSGSIRRNRVIETNDLNATPLANKLNDRGTNSTATARYNLSAADRDTLMMNQRRQNRTKRKVLSRSKRQIELPERVKGRRPDTLPKRVVGRNMGGMMQRPMGYKHGTSVTASCKLGRNKPTKIT